ncbi:MAG: 4-(cytidine 5'-diphospho)-2-C-methyl-D-erythritol kinase [Phycisphaerales bacterium JB059]
MSEPATISRPAHAKVNLALSVAPPEPSGMHPICSWMACVDLADDLTLTRLGPEAPSAFDLRWEDGSPVGWGTEADLTFRAHAALEGALGRRLPVRVELRKTIPDGGGLGGGSSDAASLLLALNDLFGLGRTIDELREVARPLGSDIAFFLDEVGRRVPRPAIVSGLGDRIERTGALRGEVTLVSPPFGCATGRVYRAYDREPGALREEAVRAMAEAPPEASRLFNDLAVAAERVEPRLGELRSYLAGALGLPVHVSGSGSTLFVIGPEGSAERTRLSAPSCRVLPTRFV